MGGGQKAKHQSYAVQPSSGGSGHADGPGGVAGGMPAFGSMTQAGLTALDGAHEAVNLVVSENHDSYGGLVTTVGNASQAIYEAKNTGAPAQLVLEENKALHEASQEWLSTLSTDAALRAG